MKDISRFASVLLIVLSAAACNANATSAPDQIATDVARAQAVAATLTAAAPTQVVAEIVPTNTSEAVPTATPTVEPPTATLKPTVDAPQPPTPTNTPVQQAADSFLPGTGDPRGLSGGILLPNYAGPLDPPVFTDRVNIRLKVFDPHEGHTDGAGIKLVNFTITSPTGDVVVDQNEGSAAYCAFSNPQGSPDCNEWNFVERADTWPKGQPICEGVYNAQIIVTTDNPNTNGALWNFNFTVQSRDGSLPKC